VLDAGKAGLAQDVAGPHHARRHVAAPPAVPAPRCGRSVGEEEQVAHPRGVDAVGGPRPHESRRGTERVVEHREVVPPTAVELVELLELHERLPP
jgi:hypothetical protein